jgi:hypothetical protein
MFRTSKKLLTLSAGLSFLAVASYAQQSSRGNYGEFSVKE